MEREKNNYEVSGVHVGDLKFNFSSIILVSSLPPYSKEPLC